MRFLITYIPAALLFCLAATHLIDVPGLYFDAVNPDYLAVSILHPSALEFPTLAMSEVMLLDRFPVVGQIYHGTLPLYIGLPIYWAFGTGLVGIRLANTAFGLIVLAGAAAFSRAWNVRPAIAATTLCALALDPAFIFDWRTQFYITTLPLAPLLASVALTQSIRLSPSRRATALAGLLAGVACYGYFIFAFLAPICFLHAAHVLRRDHKSMIPWWLGGFALGVAPYALALALIWESQGTFGAFVAFVRSLIGGIDPNRSQLGLIDRANLFFQYFSQSLQGTGPKAMMISEFPGISPTLRVTLLLGLPALGIALWQFPRTKPPGLLVLAGFCAGLFFLVMAFGNRLWLHHFALLIPVLYLAMASVLEGCARALTGRVGRVAFTICGAAMFALLIGANTVDAKAVFEALNRTGGVGLSSDAIDRFAMDSLKSKDPTFYVFPDWGPFGGFVMLTQGTLPYDLDFDAAVAHRKLCKGQDVVVVLVMGKEPARLTTWGDALHWSAPLLSTYHQRNGPDVLSVARWKAGARPAGACG